MLIFDVGQADEVVLDNIDSFASLCLSCIDFHSIIFTIDKRNKPGSTICSTLAEIRDA